MNSPAVNRKIKLQSCRRRGFTVLRCTDSRPCRRRHPTGGFSALASRIGSTSRFRLGLARVWIGAVLALLIWGCGGPGLIVEPIAEPDDPGTLLRRFEKDIQAAREDEVDVLAPVWFAAAESSLETAREALAAGREPLQQLSQGRAQLLAARDASQIVQALMPKVMENRRLARAAGAHERLAEYAAVEDAFRKTARAAEAGNTVAAARNRESLADSYRRLELQAITTAALSDVRRLLQQAEGENTMQPAPRSYAEAVSRLQQAEAFIAKDRYNREEIRRMVEEARFYARRHLEIAAQSRSIETQSLEEVILSAETRLHRIADRLNAPDLRDHPLDTQVENILGAIEAQLHDRSTAIDDQKREVAALQSRIEELENRRRHQEMARERLRSIYHRVEALFEPHEAALHLRQGQIVIRLRGMKFAVGDARILPENQRLLAKVGKALSLFEDFDVIIEGHTDDAGSDDVNEILSEQRAEAVRHYLVINEDLPYDRMIAVGYGAGRPVATNATEAGRALNRRIDLIVIPPPLDNRPVD